VKRVGFLLLCTLTLAATFAPVVAGAVPTGLADGGGARGHRTADQPPGYVEQLIIVVCSAFAAGVFLGLRPAPGPRRRRPGTKVGVPAMSRTLDHEPTPAPTPESPIRLVPRRRAEPPDDLPLPVHTAPPMRLIAPPQARAAEMPTRERHLELYDAEYAEQLIRIQRLRETIRTRIALDGTAAATENDPGRPPGEDP
jgi:hypothetical protein